jgi:hypothetical protein
VRPAIAASSIVAAAGILAAGLALRPAFAGSDGVHPFAYVKCTSGSPCQTYKNTSTGAGLQGINTSSSPFASGLIGSAGQYANGVSGNAGTYGNGVNGSGGNTGVSGTGGTWGVYGYTSLAYGTGVQGQSVNGDGIVAYSSNYDGMSTSSGTGNGLFAIAGSNGVAVYGVGGTGDAIHGAAAWGSGAVGLRATNDGDNGSDGNGADMEGSYIGAIARNKAGQGWPLVAADTNGQDLMFVASAGNLYYHGGLYNFAKTHDGHVAMSYGSTSTSPTIEDNGTARLVGGVATVTLDPAFAASIDTHKAYQVVLTPDGDTKGLYISGKSPTAFQVREVQGGRGTLDFDYHIYAPTLGQAGRHMVELTPSQAASMMPHAPFTVRPIHQALKVNLLHH